MGVPRAILIPVASLLIGLGGGLAIGYRMAPDSPDSIPHQHTVPSQRSAVPDGTERLKKNYDRALKTIEQDEKTDRLTKDRAAKLRNKLAEAYAYRKTVSPANQTERDELRAKRTEWRGWAEQNDLSMRYFTPLY